MTRHLRMLPAALALALVPVTASPAHAAGSDYVGDCGFDTVSQTTVTGEDVFVGVVYAAVVLYSSGDGNVVNATVTCDIKVNGVTQDSASGWGSGVVAFADTLRFRATDVDWVDLCTTVDFTSDDTPSETRCSEPVGEPFPPQHVTDYLTTLIDWVNGLVVAYVDPTVCQVFPLLAPGLPPHVTVNEQGDVFLGADPFWDCPPYDLFPQPNPPPSELPLPPTAPVVPTGAGYNVGDAGLQALTSPSRDVASACGYEIDRVTNDIVVVGSTLTLGADTAHVRCRLTDTATGAVLYDQTVSAGGPVATVNGVVPASVDAITVCTEGTGVWSDRTVTVGPYCRPGERLAKLVP